MTYFGVCHIQYVSKNCFCVRYHLFIRNTRSKRGNVSPQWLTMDTWGFLIFFSPLTIHTLDIESLQDGQCLFFYLFGSERIDTDKNSVEFCTKRCEAAKYPFAAVEDGDVCSCYNINQVEKAEEKRSSKCNMRCPGNAQQKCGGRHYANIYSTEGIQ